MNEGDFESIEVDVSQDEIERRIHNLAYRNPPQKEVISRIVDHNNSEQTYLCAKIMSDSMNDLNNAELRRLIANKEVEKATEILISIVQGDERWKLFMKKAA